MEDRFAGKREERVAGPPTSLADLYSLSHIAAQFTPINPFPAAYLINFFPQFFRSLCVIEIF
jgi:hypothetical protein